MTSITRSDAANWARLVREDRDKSLYGSLWIVIACLGVLATLLLPG